MPNAKKQSKTMYYLPGIIVICLGLYMLTVKTPSRTIAFGADFYTETYQAIAEVAHIIKVGTGLLLVAMGTVSLGRGAAEAGRSDLVLERLDAIHQAVIENATKSSAAAGDEATPAVTPEPPAAEDSVSAVVEVSIASEEPVPSEGSEPPTEILENQPAEAETLVESLPATEA